MDHDDATAIVLFCVLVGLVVLAGFFAHDIAMAYPH